MQNFKISVILSVLFLITFSCSNSEEKKLLIGDWNGAEWLVGGNPSDYDAKQVHFTFKTDGGYSSDFGGDKEKGTYLLRDNSLYTTPEGQLEIMVKIQKLTSDSLVFDMNRSGQAETLTLIRK
ncbi:MAG TPA: lipocalin family protein [Chitinophagales bacterium]|nr:lipocalin family protein [Chitinophagales bacterium]